MDEMSPHDASRSVPHAPGLTHSKSGSKRSLYRRGGRVRVGRGLCAIWNGSAGAREKGGRGTNGLGGVKRFVRTHRTPIEEVPPKAAGRIELHEE